MEGLQRSAVSFRRQGSSGLVWDDKFLSGELTKPRDDVQGTGDSTAQPPAATLERSRSAGEGGRRYHRTARDSPVAEPPSPRVSACGFCGAFGKPKPNLGGGKARKTKHGNMRLR
ncbi:hypothetical protein MLD38_029656 [Melastoma candidum]|uniref:Uncharacterized protein n=1 Tax=Melastoma candidum TaxID=119954 RepID=A0ACB9N4D3_9MYRT|nr:hypothetical protein MLD38_029656 [Melastoma candidum]